MKAGLPENDREGNEWSTLYRLRQLREKYFLSAMQRSCWIDLAELYRVETKVLKQAVRRNISRFPDDFMFELSKEEFQNWRSQFVTSRKDRIGLRYSPMVFTEQGVLKKFIIHNSKFLIFYWG